MPNTSSYADIVRDWELLLTAVADNTEDLAEVERHRAALEQHLAKVKATKARQDSAAAIKQQTTQELQKELVEGRELAMRLRGGVKANMGPRNERLVQFGMAPLRKRRRAEKPTEGESPGPAPPSFPVAPRLPQFSNSNLN